MVFLATRTVRDGDLTYRDGLGQCFEPLGRSGKVFSANGTVLFLAKPTNLYFVLEIIFRVRDTLLKPLQDGHLTSREGPGQCDSPERPWTVIFLKFFHEKSK